MSAAECNLHEAPGRQVLSLQGRLDGAGSTALHVSLLAQVNRAATGQILRLILARSHSLHPPFPACAYRAQSSRGATASSWPG